MIGVLNAAMYGTPSEPGEHVDWSAPDLFSPADFAELVGQTVEEFAAQAPHMIVFEAEAAA